MKKILVASTNEGVLKTVRAACQKYANYFDAVFLSTTDETLSYVSYELPEIKVLDFTSENSIDAIKILNEIHADPWLHNGGIIAIVANNAEAQKLEEKKDSNILVIQTVKSFHENFARLLRILWSNQHFLFNRGIQERIGGRETGSFVCGSDPLDIRMYTNFLVSYLYNTNRISSDDRYKLQTTLMELLTNALEHGNLKISYEEKTECLNRGGNILELIYQKNKLPELINKKIYISYIIGKNKSRFRIRDDGDGFDWKACLEKEFTDHTHGRGMKISQSLVHSLSYNEKGNEVTFDILNLQDEANTVPGIMKPFETELYKDKEVVCYENDNTNDLYFIVSGRYAVYTNRKLISVLTPNDMFIGEMSFLLNDRRSATILSIGEGRLIKIPKVSFLQIIRNNPHYGIFLSKLLAQRLLKQNRKTLMLAEEIVELKKLADIPEDFDE